MTQYHSDNHFREWSKRRGLLDWLTLLSSVAELGQPRKVAELFVSGRLFQRLIKAALINR